MVSDTDLAYRLQGLPSSLDKDDIIQCVKQGLNLDPDCSVKIRSISPDALDSSQQVVTLGFNKKPKALEKDNFHLFTAELDDGEKYLSVDTRFDGFTPLHSVKDEESTLE